MGRTYKENRDKYKKFVKNKPNKNRKNFNPNRPPKDTESDGYDNTLPGTIDYRNLEGL